MKTKYEIRSRAKKLAVKYLKSYMSEKLDKHHYNCQYNHIHEPMGTYTKSQITNLDYTPRKHVSLLVIQPEQSIGLCTYGSDNTKIWNGDKICDSDNVSKNCQYFESKYRPRDLFEEFKIQLEDDVYTKRNYPDLAALQWVLSDRMYSKLWYPFVWIYVFMLKRFLDRLRSKPTEHTELPKDVW